MSAQSSSATQRSTAAEKSDAIHPFRINIPKSDITELRRRITQTELTTSARITRK